MSLVKTNAILDASGGTTATVNGYTPTVSNMAGRNKIINGAMVIDQRNGGATLTGAGNGSWAVDRWICYHDIATVNTGQALNSITPPAGFSAYLGLQVTTPATATSGQYTNFQHYIEGFNTADLAWGTASAQPITISFWVRSSITGTQGFALQNAASALGYPFTVTINSANTWEYKTVTIAGPTTGTWNTTNGRGITLIVDLGMGSSFRFTAGSWQSGNVQGVTGANSLNQTSGATFYITGVQLEAGSVATPFDFRQYGQELALCQRYFEICGRHHVGGVWGSTFGTSGGTRLDLCGTFKVTKRAAPTCTSVGTISYTLFGSSAQTGSNQTFFDTSINGVSCEITISSDVSGRTGTLYTDNIWASAEL